MKESSQSHRASSWRRALLATGVAAALFVPVMAQETGKDAKPAAKAEKASQKTPSGKGHWGPGDEYADSYDFGVFVGGTRYNTDQNGFGEKLHTGGLVGFQLTENPWKWIGIEESYGYHVNNATAETPMAPGEPNYGAGARMNEFEATPLFYLKPRGSRFRPYVNIGVALLDFHPTKKASTEAESEPALVGLGGIGSSPEWALTFGVGAKYHLNQHWGVEAALRDNWSHVPTFGTFAAPNASYPNAYYLPRTGSLLGLELRAGVNYYIGKTREWVPEPEPPAPQALAPLTGGTLSAGNGTLCQGKAIVVRSAGAADPAGRGLTYKWKVDGQPAGSNSPELSFTPEAAGNHNVELEVSAENTAGMPIRTASAAPLALGVQEYKAPTVSGCAAIPAELGYGDSAKLNATATGSTCSTITFAWTAAEGTIADPTAASTSFDSKSVKFEQGGKIQAKTVAVSGKVSDDRGASASCDTSVKVNFIPNAIRFGDIIFGKGSARVNNCGKRILLEELAPKAADPDYDIVLIGHFDKDEAPKTKLQKINSIDKQRVLETYAVLTAGAGKSGKGTCANVDKTRVKVDWVAEDQTDDKQPGLCGTSARPATKERRGSVVSTADDNRRVEVWLVPKGTKLPAGFKAEKDLSAKDIARTLKTLACPK
jgi:opacity protein-like surface antigen